MIPSPCIICDTKLESAIHDPHYNQPYKGTCFETGGHYGSTYFDPMDGSALSIVICDNCLKDLEEKQKLLYRIGKEYSIYTSDKHP